MLQPKGGRLAALVVALLLQNVTDPGGLCGQVPDTAAADTLGFAVQESDTAAADTATLSVFPVFPEPATQSPGLAVRWDHGALLANAVLDLADFLEYTPPLVAVRAGFFEGPQASVFLGAGPASLRLTIDGYEYAPLTGGAFDWHQVSLVEQKRVQMIREPGGFEVATETYRRDRPEPYSRVEGGTGDPDHNMVRALLATEFFGSPAGFGFDRVNAEGSAELGEGTRTALWAHLARRLPGGVWGQIEFRRSAVERDSFPSPERNDWVLRLRRPFAGGWYADLIAGTGRHEEQAEPVPGTTDTMPEISIRGRQIALRGARVSDRWRAFVSLRVWDGEGLPDFEPEAAVEFMAGPATVFARGRYSDWGSFKVAGGYAALNVKLPLGLRAVAEVEEGDRGLIAGIPTERVRYTRWTAGGELERWGWTVRATGGRWRVDPSPGLGLPFDSATSQPGGTVSVFEGSAGGHVLRLFGGSISVEGRYFRREAGSFLYWPQEEWHLQGIYHNLLLGDQLEIILRGLGGVRGSMAVSDRTQEPNVLVSSEDLSWFWGEVVVRIKDVHVFYGYEAFDAPSGPRDAPAFPLRRSRTFFGLKWEFLN